MGEPIVYLSLYSLMALWMVYKTCLRDLFFGAVFFFLYIYSIFALVGYAYFPQLSIALNVYFGPDLVAPATVFIALSLGALFLLTHILYHYVVRPSRIIVVYSKSPYGVWWFYGILVGQLLWMSWFLVNHQDELNYSNVSKEAFYSESGLSFVLFGICFKLMVLVNIVLYVSLRLKEHLLRLANSKVVLGLFVSEALLFLAICAKLGSRTDVLALSVALVVFEAAKAAQSKLSWKVVLSAAVFLAVAVSGMSAIEQLRRDGGVEETGSAVERVLFQDYYAPAHILFASMGMDIVDPKEVFISNYSNALVGKKHPYLQAYVTDYFLPGLATRSASFAFYVFSEGFLVLGWFGFIYNACVLFLGLALWRSLACTPDRSFNLFALAMVSSQAASIARGQTSYFIKTVYMYFIPGVLVFFLLTGYRYAVSPRKRS